MPVLPLIPLALFAMIGVAVGALSACIELAERQRARLYARPRVRRAPFRPSLIIGGKPEVLVTPALPSQDTPAAESLPARAAQRQR